MQLSWQNIVGGIGLVFAAMFAWFGALWLNLQGANLWFVRLCIFLLLALIVLAVVWWLRKREREKAARAASAGSENVPAGATDDILLLLREAEARVASSTQLPRGTRLSSLPVAPEGSPAYVECQAPRAERSGTRCRESGYFRSWGWP